MPKIVVEIEWDVPEDVLWLNPDNVALALHAHCQNTKFKVLELDSFGAPETLSVRIADG